MFPFIIEQQFMLKLIQVIFICPDEDVINEGSRIFRKILEAQVSSGRMSEMPKSIEYQHVNITGTPVTNGNVTILITDTVMWYIAESNGKVYSYIANQ